MMTRTEILSDLRNALPGPWTDLQGVEGGYRLPMGVEADIVVLQQAGRFVVLFGDQGESEIELCSSEETPGEAVKELLARARRLSLLTSDALQPQSIDELLDGIRGQLTSFVERIGAGNHAKGWPNGSRGLQAEG